MPLGWAAGTARTAQSALGGRFTLRVGTSHAMVVEGFFGESYGRPFTHTAEYLDALGPVLTGESCDVDGDEGTANGWLTVESEPVPVLLVALGPRMLDFADQRCAGTSLGPGMSPQVIAEHVAPRIRTAAASAGRPAPRIKAPRHCCGHRRPGRPGGRATRVERAGRRSPCVPPGARPRRVGDASRRRERRHDGRRCCWNGPLRRRWRDGTARGCCDIGCR